MVDTIIFIKNNIPNKEIIERFYNIHKSIQIPNQKIMEKDNAIKIFNSRKLITGPGKFNLKVTSTTPFQREDGTLVQITNYAAMTPYQLTEAKRLGKEGNWEEATQNSLSSSQRIGKDYLPAKGELVDVVVDHIINKEDIEILAVVGVTAMKTTKATSINFEDAEVEEESLVEASNEQPAGV